MNYFNINFKAIEKNIMFSRMVISSFLIYLDPSIEVLNDIKTAVSEAVTNSVIHSKSKEIQLECLEEDRKIKLIIRDFGIGISDIERAKEAFYTSTDGRAGIGFTVMNEFMDNLIIESSCNIGTTVIMEKTIL